MEYTYIDTEVDLADKVRIRVTIGEEVVMFKYDEEPTLECIQKCVDDYGASKAVDIQNQNIGE